MISLEVTREFSNTYIYQLIFQGTKYSYSIHADIYHLYIHVNFLVKTAIQMSTNWLASIVFCVNVICSMFLEVCYDSDAVDWLVCCCVWVTFLCSELQGHFNQNFYIAGRISMNAIKCIVQMDVLFITMINEF